MKKVVLLIPGFSAAVAMAVVGAGHAGAEAPDVTGETYANAVAILQAQGYTTVFGGSVGSGLPESQCIVIEQKGAPTSQWGSPPGQRGTVRLRLDCKLAPGQTRPPAPNTRSLVPRGGSVPGNNGGNRPTPGAGTVTVTPVPIG